VNAGENALEAALWLHEAGIPTFGPGTGIRLIEISKQIPDDAPPEVLAYRDALREVCFVAAFQQRLVITAMEVALATEAAQRLDEEH
jgi:hypothetical protein